MLVIANIISVLHNRTRNAFVPQMDPALELHRKELVMESGRKLDKARMIRFDERTCYFASTDLGRTASHFYIRYNTIEVDPV